MKKYDEYSKDEPKWEKIFTVADCFPPKIYDNGYECKSYGYITYKGNIYPVYSDDYGCQDFIIYRYRDNSGEIKEHDISVCNTAGILDWWFELNRMKDECPDEVLILELPSDYCQD